jgi:hypothetical protein
LLCRFPRRRRWKRLLTARGRGGGRGGSRGSFVSRLQKEGVLQRLEGGDTVSWIVREHPLDEVLEFEVVRHRVPHLTSPPAVRTADLHSNDFVEGPDRHGGAGGSVFFGLAQSVFAAGGRWVRGGICVGGGGGG